MVTDPGPPGSDDAATANMSARSLLGHDAASRRLGIKLCEVGPGRATTEMVVRADMVNGWCVCHGALVVAVTDTSFAVACHSYGEVTVAAGFDITLLAPARVGDRLVASAERRGGAGRSGIYDAIVACVDDWRGRTIVAELRGRSTSSKRRVEVGVPS